MPVILNADNGAVSGISGLTTSADNSGVLQFQSSGTATLEISTTGNINIPGTGKRITGDMSNATVANRLALQTNTTNGVTVVHALPNGTSTSAFFEANNASDPTNAAHLQIGMDSTNSARISSSIRGTGTYLPLTMNTGGSERLRIDTSGNVGIGTSSISTVGSYRVTEINGTQGGYLRFSTGGAASGAIGAGSGGAFLESFGANSLIFYNNNAERMRIDSSGNVGIGTSSPLNKLNVNALSAGAASARFTDGTNSTLLVVHPSSGVTGLDGYGSLAMLTGGSERMRIDSSGNVGIGTSSVGRRLDVAGSARFIQDNPATTGAITLRQNSGDTVGGYIQWVNNANTVERGWMVVDTSSNMLFATGSTERMRIDSGGRVGINQTPSTRQFSVTQNTAGNYAAEFIQLSSTGHAIAASCNSSDTTGRFFDGYSSSAGTSRILIYSNGNVVNSNNSYGALSDIKLKENIVDATPKLDKLNQVRVVNYNIKGDTQKQIGVVAQELEQIFPSMIEESPDVDRNGNDLGTTTKQVKYSVFVPILIKAIQEQQAIINDLKAEVEALKARG